MLEERFSAFKSEKPYCSEIQLSITSDFSKKNVQIIADSTGIIIGITDDQEWYFSTIDFKNICHIVANKDCSVLHAYADTERCFDFRELTDNLISLLRLAIECNLAYNNGISVHASCINYNGQAILFTAPSGTGKSTHASLWGKTMGAKLISGDRPHLHVSATGINAYGVPWDGKEQIFLQENYPVLAMVEIRRANNNWLRKLNDKQAFSILLKQVMLPMWDDYVKFSAYKTIKNITQTVPIYRLFCLPDTNAVELVKTAIYDKNTDLIKEVQPEMQLKEGFILKNIVDEWIVMPTGLNINTFDGAIVLNEVSAFLWKLLENPISREDLLLSVLNEYDISEQEAAKDLDEFLGKLKTNDLLKDN